MPRLRSLKKVLEKAQPPQPVQVRAPQPKLPPQKRPFETPDPSKYSQHSQKLHEKLVSSIAENKPHFAIGGKEIWFPWAPVTLLTPSAKMTPYQAQFQVPKNFNKLDLRDYLWHVYGLRALNITTQIKWSRWDRLMGPRYRTPQVKKMIIEMEEPFVWPQPDLAIERLHRKENDRVFADYEAQMSERKGSDLKKPLDVVSGIMGPYPDPPQGFIPRKVKSQLKNEQKRSTSAQTRREQEALLAAHLKLD